MVQDIKYDKMKGTKSSLQELLIGFKSLKKLETLLFGIPLKYKTWQGLLSITIPLKYKT